jgi:hypothetical protein
MDNQSKHVKLYVGSMISLRALEGLLDRKQIPSLIKNLQESARLGGFGTTGAGNELYVYEEDLENAKIILEDFLNKE